MCQHDNTDAPTPPAALTRRNALAAASVLAGVSAVGVVSAPAAHADAPSAERGVPNYRGKPPVVDPLIVEGATMLDPVTGRVIEDSVIVLAHGKVLASGTRNATRSAVRSVGRHTRRIDAAGKWVLPGLVDAHVHMNSLADAAAVLHAGATTVRSGSSNFYQDVALRPLAKWVPGTTPRVRAAGVFVSPNLGDTVLADPHLAPLAALPNGVQSTADLRYLTRVNISRGVDVVKTRANPRAGLPEQDPTELVYDQEQLSAVVGAAGRAGVLCHAYSKDGIDGAVRAGVRSIEHGVFVGDATLNLMARKGTRFTPTLSAIIGLSASTNPILAARGREYAPILQAAVREAHSRGVTVVAGTDSFGLEVDPIGKEVRLLIEAGLTHLEAVRAATIYPARLLGWANQVGQLARGFRADLVVVDANPLQDATALEKIVLIVAQGVVARSEM